MIGFFIFMLIFALWIILISIQFNEIIKKIEKGDNKK